MVQRFAARISGTTTEKWYACQLATVPAIARATPRAVRPCVVRRDRTASTRPMRTGRHAIVSTSPDRLASPGTFGDRRPALSIRSHDTKRWSSVEMAMMEAAQRDLPSPIDIAPVSIE